MLVRIETKNSLETRRLGEILAKEVLKTAPRRGAVVLALAGGLGAGKTTFIQGFAAGAGVKEKVLSPTFLILRRFRVKKGRYLYHLDCYRLKNAKDILELGFREIVSDPANIVVVEWADKISKLIPAGAFRIGLTITGEKRRHLEFRVK